MPETIQNIDRTTEDGLCTSCGICAAVCPVSCIHFERQKETYLPVIDYGKCIRCGKCLKVCPGYSYTYPPQDKNEPLCFSACAKDSKLLKNASSGGIITAMIQKLLRDGQYDKAFLVFDYNYDNQVKTEAVRKGDNLKKTQQSRYVPVSQEKAVKYILENPLERIIFVGTGCAVHGLCNALKAAGRGRENILMFGLFCDQTMTYSIYEYMKNLKPWNSPVQSVHFRDKRAGGWPGNLRIEFRNGTHVHLNARERMLVKDFCRQKRCLYCMDKLNAEADLSVGDNYTKKDSTDKGSGSLIIRTNAGRKAWELCRDEFHVFPADYRDIKESQHLEKKFASQWKNNLIYAEGHGGRSVESGLPCDLALPEAIGQEVGKKDRKLHNRQLSDLELGERKAYRQIRMKRLDRFGRMCCGWLLTKLRLYMEPKRGN